MDTKSPPRVEAEAPRASFPARPIKQPHDGFFMLDWTLDHILKGSLGVRSTYLVVAPLKHSLGSM